MPAARQRSRSPARAAAVIAMIGTCWPAGLVRPDQTRRFVPVHLRHLAIHQDCVVLQPLQEVRPPPRRWRRRLRGSPGARPSCTVTFRLAALSSTTRTRDHWRVCVGRPEIHDRTRPFGAQRPFGEQRVKDVEQLRRAHRFDELGVDAGHRVVRLAGGGQENHDELFQPLVGSDLGSRRPRRPCPASSCRRSRRRSRRPRAPRLSHFLQRFADRSRSSARACPTTSGSARGSCGWSCCRRPLRRTCRQGSTGD